MCRLVIKSSPLFSVQIRCLTMCLHKLITEWHCSREKLVVSHQASRNPRFRLGFFLVTRFDRISIPHVIPMSRNPV